MESQPMSRGVVRPFDPKKGGKYKVRLGDVSKKNNASLFKSVAFNHKPSQTGSSRKTTITQVHKAEDGYELRIEDITGDEPMNYTYSGSKTAPENAYILTFDNDQQSVQIDSLSSAYAFNMVSAPWENDAEELRKQYSQVDTQTAHADSSEKPTSGSEAEDFGGESDGPDDNNPFDYRHYLNGIPGAQPESKPPSLAATPLLVPRAGSGSPRPMPRTNGTSPALKPVHVPAKKARAEPAKRQPNKVYKSAEKIIDSDASDDNDGGLLIIDNGPKPPAKKRRTPNPSDKPRSLHAVAMAENPRENSSVEKDAGSGYEEDDESDEPKQAPSTSAPKSVNIATVQDKKSHADDDEIDDGFKLPGPVKSRAAPPLVRRQSMWEPGEEEELEAALEAELEADDDDEDKNDQQQQAAQGTTSQRRAQESESESEEE